MKLISINPVEPDAAGSSTLPYLASVLAPALVNLAKGALPDEVDDMVILYPHLGGGRGSAGRCCGVRATGGGGGGGGGGSQLAGAGDGYWMDGSSR
jgi:hypothetical protein